LQDPGCLGAGAPTLLRVLSCGGMQCHTMPVRRPSVIRLVSGQTTPGLSAPFLSPASHRPPASEHVRVNGAQTQGDRWSGGRSSGTRSVPGPLVPPLGESPLPAPALVGASTLLTKTTSTPQLTGPRASASPSGPTVGAPSVRTPRLLSAPCLASRSSEPISARGLPAKRLDPARVTSGAASPILGGGATPKLSGRNAWAAAPTLASSAAAGAATSSGLRHLRTPRSSAPAQMSGGGAPPTQPGQSSSGSYTGLGLQGMPPRVPQRRHSSSSCVESAADGKRSSQGKKASMEKLPLAPLLASSATTLPPAGSPREWLPPPMAAPLHGTPRAALTPQSCVTIRRAGDVVEHPLNGTLQAECTRLREELERERAEKCALAMRFDALSRMWEAAGQPREPALRAVALSGGSRSSATGLIEEVSPSSPDSLHSSVRTLMDESSIIPDASAIVGRGAVDVTPTLGRPGRRGMEEELVGTPSLRLPCRYSSPSQSPRTISPHRNAHRGILTEMTTSGVLGRDLGVLNVQNESLAYTPSHAGNCSQKIMQCGSGTEISFVLSAN